MTNRIGAVITAGLGAIVLSGCGGSNSRDGDDEPVVSLAEMAPEPEPPPSRPEVGMPITVPGRDVCLVPLTVESTGGWFPDREPATGESPPGAAPSDPVASLLRISPVGSGHYGGPVRWHNVLFRDLRSNEQWPLLGRRGVVSAWYPLGPRDERGALTEARALVFLITQHDTNRDGTLDDRDERVAIVTGGDGREVTPGSAQVWRVAYEEARGVVYFLVASDTNGDGRFDGADEPDPYVLRLDQDTTARPVIASDLMDQALRLLR